MFAALARAFAALWKKLNELPAAAPKLSDGGAGLKPAPTVSPSSQPPAGNPLAGKPLRYLIGTDVPGLGREGEVTEVSYDTAKPVARGTSIKYCNLFDEKNTGGYGPYLHSSDTAQKYGEGHIDPKGAGWAKNITEQLDRAQRQGFRIVEWDNPDAYGLTDVLGVLNLTWTRNIQVIAKNPLVCEWDATAYLAHPAVVGVIVERGAGSPADMNTLRKKAGKPDLPVWFVAFGDGRAWAGNTANQARQFAAMGVTYSGAGEYGSSADLFVPVAPKPAPAVPDGGAVPPVGAGFKPAPTASPDVPYGADYLAQWQAMAIKPERAAAVAAIAKKLIASKQRYSAVALKTGVPWYVIAVLHERESGADFATYLGNGDPLNRRTTHVPAGRGPFATWEAGAIDALAYDGLDKIKARSGSWPIERIAYECEKYNGMGYRARGVPSPYLWSFSSIYKGGKYVADGVWSASAQDAQCGVMPMLKAMAELDPSIKLTTDDRRQTTKSTPAAGGDHPSSVVRPPSSDPPKPVPLPSSPELHDLGHRIKRTMLGKNYPWFPDQNVVSVEGMDPDGKPNANRPNAFDDIKMVLDGGGKIIGGPYEATTQPGKYWTDHPMAEGGAFIISLGPQACWGPPGDYHGHTVWRQAEGSTILGTRDPHATYKRQGPPIPHGNIGVHHHGGYNLPRDNISNAAAGCQVIRLTDKQAEFMALTMQCPRYLADKPGYRLTATVLEAKDIAP